MLTIFSIPKPFVGQIGVMQRNAISSWARLRPLCEIILFADEAGTGEAAAEFGARHVAEVARNEYGTPLLDSAFARAEGMASQGLLCYVNADIILMSDFPRAAERAARRLRRFLMVGQRWTVKMEEAIAGGPGWEKALREQVKRHGRLDPPCGSDYFVWPRGSIGELPAFAVGRPFWDTWLIYRARSLGLPVVDASRVVTAIHQEHDYSHVPDQRGESWHGPEADRNLELTGDLRNHLYRILDATHMLTSWGLTPAWGYRHLQTRFPALRVLDCVRRPLGVLRRLVVSHARCGLGRGGV